MDRRFFQQTFNRTSLSRHKYLIKIVWTVVEILWYTHHSKTFSATYQ